MSARRRERRVPDAAARANRTDPAARASRTSVDASNRRWSVPFSVVFCSFFLLLIVVVYFAALRGREHDAAPRDTARLSVYERGLVRREVSAREILAENSKVSGNTSSRHFLHPVLAYVTPWNSLGYEMAERFGSKMTHISPVWYDLKSDGKKLVLEGRHNVDGGWISRLRTNGRSLVLPRVVLEAFPSETLQKKKQRDKVVDMIVKECKEMGYDGIVLESWSRWAAFGVLHDVDMRQMALEFIKQLGLALHSVRSAMNPDHHLELVYVIPAPRSQDLKEHDFGPEDLQQLSDVVDGFSLMTYDFSSPHSPGPNAPLLWVRSCLQLLLGNNNDGVQSIARKIFVGINFYGNDFILSEGLDGGAITGRDYLSLLQKHMPTLQWENRNAEHFFTYSHNNVRHAVFYPSLMSIFTRMEEARAWGAGLSIWEIGQGLDYFFDLL